MLILGATNDLFKFTLDCQNIQNPQKLGGTLSYQVKNYGK
jgi:hypothetical protein